LKISLSVGGVVTLTLSIFAFFLIQNQKEHLLYAKIKEIETISTLLRHSVANFMKEGETKDFHNFLNLFGISDDLLEVRILSEAGRVLYSSRKTEEGSSMAHLFPGGTISGKIPPVFEQELRGHPFLSAVRTFQNEPVCFPCHGQDKKVLGILHVSLPMETTRQGIIFNRDLLIAAALITLLLMGLAINLLLTRLVKKPIGRLIETISQVEQGNLDVKMSLGTQDELGRLAKNFQSMVQELSAAQKAVERQHQQQMLQVQHLASLGELAASVAHEIRNPLAGIKLAIQILAKEPGLAAGHRETITEIMRSIERLDKTMTDLLLYSRMRPPEFQPVPLQEIIEDALSSIKEEIQSAGVQVEKTFDPALPLLRLDPQQVMRVFLNLFLNALQAMDQGGTLKITTKRYESGYPFPKDLIASEESFLREGWAEANVTDTGEGMPPEVQKEIFRPFFTTKAKGTGLGLSLSRRIVEQHHGHIFVRSEVGAGTTFSLLFPIPPPEGDCGAIRVGEHE
jgi:two-component system NtrC family sensor kinase